jgi:HK97 family phage prohead protease
VSEILYSAPLRIAEIKAGDGGMEVAGYVSTFGNVDFGGDIVQPSAFEGTLSAKAPVRFLYSHDSHQVLGKPLELRVDDKGLFGRFQISQTQLGKDVHTLLRDGALDSFSIGYIPTDVDHDEKGNRLLKSVDLLECSVVAMPMNTRATVTAVKDVEGKDWHIEKQDGKFCVVGGASGDRVFGCHATRAEALDHMRALYANVPDSSKAWSTAYINDLPDSAFASIESGGKKDSEGKTTPRSLRHYPHHDKDGKLDENHLRNALSRIGDPSNHQGGKAHLASHARSAGIGSGDSKLSEALGEFSPETAISDLMELRWLYATLEREAGLLIEQSSRPDPEEVKHTLNRLALARTRAAYRQRRTA